MMKRSLRTKKSGMSEASNDGITFSGDITVTSRENTKFLASDDADNEDACEVIVDRFETLEDVRKEIKKEGLEHCGLIFGIDYTLSNRLQGQKTFGGLSLHDLSNPQANPYQEVICILGETLEHMAYDDGTIPAFGFGDKVVKDRGIFPLMEEGECDGFGDVLDAYTEMTPKIKLGGPTNFAPLIRKAVEIVKEKREFHVLVIVADGQVTNEQETTDAIVMASDFPLSIVMIGVGDGPWEMMHDFDVNLPERRFDNFQFVEFHKVKENARNPQTAVALSALMLIPDQFKAVQRLELMDM